MLQRIENLASNIPMWFVHGANSSVDFNVGSNAQKIRNHVYVKVTYKFYILLINSIKTALFLL